MAEQPGNNNFKTNTSFKSVTYQQPGDRKNTKVRAQLRSHGSTSEAGASPSTAASSASRLETTTRSKDGTGLRTTSTHETSDKPDDVRPTSNDARSKAMLCPPESCKLAADALTKSFSQGTMAFRTIALRDSDNVFGRILNELQLELPSVMRLYRNMSERQSLDFIRQYGEGSGFRFYGLIFTDPILLSTAVLVGVRNQLDVQGRSLEGKTLIGVLHIERFLTRSINDALRDPVLGITDQMLLAVGLCAAYEIKHGNGACFHIHMRG